MKKTHLFNFSTTLLCLTIISVAALFAFNNPFKEVNRTVSVAADKMNVLYIGVENPLTIAVEGISNKKIQVNCDDLELRKKGNGQYIALASKPGKVKINVSGEGFAEKAMEFRVKRLPDPTAVLTNSDTGSRYNGKFSPEDFKKCKGVDVFIPNFPFDVKMEIQSYNLVRVPLKGDPVEVINRSGDFNEKARRLIEKAQVGDTYYFDKVTGKTEYQSGEVPDLKLNSMVFKIK